MAEPKKVVFGVGIHDPKVKRKALKAISTVKGIDSIDVDMKDMKLTVVGVFDPILGHEKLKKVCETKILVVEVVKKEEKKEEPKKEEPKKEDEKKNENIKVWSYDPYYHLHNMPHHYSVTTEEYPTCNCVIC